MPILRCIAILLCFPAYAHACFCIPEHASIEEAEAALYEASEFVLVASVGRTLRLPSDSPGVDSYLVAPLEPIEVFKGTPPDTPLNMRLAQLKVFSTCGPDAFAWEGHRMLLFLNAWRVTNDDLASGCSSGSRIVGDYDSHGGVMERLEHLRVLRRENEG